MHSSVIIHEEYIDDCLNSVATAMDVGCAVDWGDDPWDHDTNCQSMFEATLGEGDTCSVLDDACQEQLYCHSDLGVGVNTCVQYAGVGDSCEEYYCVDGSWCDSLDTHQCVQSSALDEACTENHHCQEGLYCLNHLCAEQLENGETCSDYGDCQSWNCDNQVCVPHYSWEQLCD